VKHLHTADIYEAGAGGAADSDIDEYGGQTEGEIDHPAAIIESNIECTITPNASRTRQTAAGIQPEGEYTGFFPARLAGILRGGHYVKKKSGPVGTPERFRVVGTPGDWGSNEGWDLEVGLEETQEAF
jgi:hypothetical protein